MQAGAYARNWSDQAVLVRTHAQIATLTETFVETGIPFTVSTRKSASTETQAATSLPSDNAVAITTFHASKGLEWPVVHVAGLEDGFAGGAEVRSDAPHEGAQLVGELGFWGEPRARAKHEHVTRAQDAREVLCKPGEAARRNH